MKLRKFKVMRSTFTDTKGAHLRFRGQWLIAAGFIPGLRFTLDNPEPGTLVLRIVTPAETSLAA